MGPLVWMEKVLLVAGAPNSPSPMLILEAPKDTYHVYTYGARGIGSLGTIPPKSKVRVQSTRHNRLPYPKIGVCKKAGGPNVDSKGVGLLLPRRPNTPK